MFNKPRNKMFDDGTHQISFKIKEKCWRNFKLCRPSFLYSCDVTSFLQKIEIITTKVSKEDFLVDMV